MRGSDVCQAAVRTARALARDTGSQEACGEQTRKSAKTPKEPLFVATRVSYRRGFPHSRNPLRAALAGIGSNSHKHRQSADDGTLRTAANLHQPAPRAVLLPGSFSSEDPFS